MSDQPQAIHRGDQRTVLVLTILYFLIELSGGLYYKSLALVTDASFMAINIAGQTIALYVARLVMKIPDKSRTFGYERAKVLSGLFNGILVGFLLFYVFSDAYRKIRHPQALDADRVLLIAIIGLAVNAYGFLIFYRHATDTNIKGALLLIANDALGSVGVILSSIVIRYTHLYFLDPLMGLIIGLLIAFPTYSLVRNSVHILMEGNPAHIDPDRVRQFITEHFPGITNIKDLHIWGLSEETIIMAVRVRTDEATYHRDQIRTMKRLLKETYGFSDIYLELYEQKQLNHTEHFIIESET